MKRLFTSLLGIFSCICFLLATERRALAYVDPGTGLLALQSLAASAAAAGYFLRKRILGLFTKKKPVADIEITAAVRKDNSRNPA